MSLLLHRSELSRMLCDVHSPITSWCVLLHYRSVGTTSLHTLLLDWLELLDPELVAQAPDLQHQLLFSTQTDHTPLSYTPPGDAHQTESMPTGDTHPMGGMPTGDAHPTGDPPTGRTHSNQAYLLALLTHQSSWSALHRCINTLLQKSPTLRYMWPSVTSHWSPATIVSVWAIINKFHLYTFYLAVNHGVNIVYSSHCKDLGWTWYLHVLFSDFLYASYCPLVSFLCYHSTDWISLLVLKTIWCICTDYRI